MAVYLSGLTRKRPKESPRDLTPSSEIYPEQLEGVVTELVEDAKENKTSEADSFKQEFGIENDKPEFDEDFDNANLTFLFEELKQTEDEEMLTITEPLTEVADVVMASKRATLFPEIETNHFEVMNQDFLVAFAHSIESLATEVLNQHIVTNLSLAAFGDSALLYQPYMFEVINFGKYHRFIGRRLNTLELHKLYYQIEKVFLSDPNRDHFVLKLTYPINYKGVSYTTLVATSEDLQSFSAICGYEVKVDFEELDENQLVAVIRKCF